MTTTGSVARIGRPRLSTREPEAVMVTAGYRPLEPYPGRNTARWRSECQACGAHVRPCYKTTMAGIGAGCCRGPFYLDHPSKSVGVYLMTHADLNAVKVGIGSATDGVMARVASHAARGWKLHWQRTGLRSHYAALDVERVVLASWRAAGLPPHVASRHMPQAGWTETAQLNLVSLPAAVITAEQAITELAPGS